jgi:hypothetical protein
MMDSLGQTIEVLIIRRSEEASFINADQDYHHELDPAVVNQFICMCFDTTDKLLLGAHYVDSGERINVAVWEQNSR